MSSVRNELALANAQELINVRGIPSPCILPRQLNAYCGARSTSHPPCFSHRKQTTSATQSALPNRPPRFPAQKRCGSIFGTRFRLD